MGRVSLRWFARCCVCVFLVLGCEESADPKNVSAADAARAEELYREASRSIQAERWTEAAALFKRGIALGPYNEGARYLLGDILVAHEPWGDVVRYYQETVAGDPKPQTSHYFWARALAKSGDLEAAIERFQRALEIDPAHEMSELAWGSLLESRGDFEAALLHYERAVEIHPEFSQALASCGRLHDRLGRPGQAGVYRERARTADPNSPMRFLYWARALLKAGRIKAALPELEIAVQQMPQNREARRLLVETRAKLGLSGH